MMVMPREAKAARANAPRAILVTHLLVALLCGAILLGFAGYIEQQADREAERVAATQADGVAKELAATIGGIDQHLLRVKIEAERGLARGGLDKEGIDRFVEEETREAPDIDVIRLTDAGGVLRYGTILPLGEEVGVADRPYFAALRDDPARGLEVFGPVQARIGNHPAMILARRLDLPGGRFAGVVVARIRLQPLAALLSRRNIEWPGSLSLRRTDMSLILRNPDLPDTTDSQAVSDEFRAAYLVNPERGVYRGRSRLDGVTRILAYHQLKLYNIVVVAGIDQNWVTSQARLSISAYGVGYLLLVAALAVSSLLVWRGRTRSTANNAG